MPAAMPPVVTPRPARRRRCHPLALLLALATLLPSAALAQTATLTLVSSPGAGGAANATDDEFPNYDVSFMPATAVLVATPEPGYHFVNWTWAPSGAVNNVSYPNEQQTSIMFNADCSFTANFAADSANWTLAVSPAQGGSTTPSPGTRTADISLGFASEPILATPASGYTFTTWTAVGDVTFTNAANANTTATIRGDCTITATFSPSQGDTVTLSMIASPDALGTTAPIPGNHPVNPGTDQPINATPSGGSTFLDWAVTGGGLLADPATAATTCRIDEATTLTAYFAPPSEAFPPAGITPAGWVRPAGDDRSWRPTGTAASAGNAALRAAAITHNQSAAIAYTGTFAGGTIRFKRKVSSESGWDHLRFFVDNSQKGQWSGELDWGLIEVPIDAGEHTVRWEYSKDSSQSSGADTAWIDEVDLPLAESGVDEWVVLGGTSNSDFALATAVDAAGNIYVGGYTYDSLGGQTHRGGMDAYVRKLDDAGNVLWTRQLGTTGDDACWGIALDGNSNVYIAGYTNGTLANPDPDDDVENANAGGYDVFIAGYNASGSHLWTEMLGTAGEEGAYDIAWDGAGHLYLTGDTTGDLKGRSNNGGQDAFLTKYTTSGRYWSTVLLGSENDEAGRGVHVNADGNVYITGHSNGDLHGNTNAGDDDIFIAKYDDSGQRQWTRTLGTSELDIAYDLDSDAAGNVTVAGRTRGDLAAVNPATGVCDVFVATFSPSGNIIRSNQIGTSESDRCYGVSVADDGTAYVAGYTVGDLGGETNSGLKDAFLATFQPNGTVDVLLLGTSDDDRAWDVVATDEAITVVGDSDGDLSGRTNQGATDIFVWRRENIGSTVTYQGHTYIAVDTALSWTDAETFASLWGGHLVSIGNDTENTFVGDLATANGLGETWIGLTDQLEEGVWRWSDGSTFAYDSWHPNQPDDDGGEEFVEIGWGGAYTWNDTSGSNPFIVEIPTADAVIPVDTTAPNNPVLTVPTDPDPYVTASPHTVYIGAGDDQGIAAYRVSTDPTPPTAWDQFTPITPEQFFATAIEYPFTVPEGQVTLYAWFIDRHWLVDPDHHIAAATPVTVTFDATGPAPRADDPVSPADGAGAVAVDTPVVITFDEPLRPGAAFSDIGLSIGGTAITAGEAIDPQDTYKLRITAAANLPSGEITVTVPAGALEDAAGNPNQPITYRFTTGLGGPGPNADDPHLAAAGSDHLLVYADDRLSDSQYAIFMRRNSAPETLICAPPDGQSFRSPRIYANGDRLYLIFKRYTPAFQSWDLVTSPDGGDTWTTDAIHVLPGDELSRPELLPTDTTLNHFYLAADGRLKHATSTDHGASWSTAVPVTDRTLNRGYKTTDFAVTSDTNGTIHILYEYAWKYQEYRLYYTSNVLGPDAWGAVDRYLGVSPVPARPAITWGVGRLHAAFSRTTDATTELVYRRSPVEGWHWSETVLDTGADEAVTPSLATRSGDLYLAWTHRTASADAASRELFLLKQTPGQGWLPVTPVTDGDGETRTAPLAATTAGVRAVIHQHDPQGNTTAITTVDLAAFTIPASATRATLEVTVTDSAGAPLAGATVRLSLAADRTAATDVYGKALFAHLEASRDYDVTVTFPGADFGAPVRVTPAADSANPITVAAAARVLGEGYWEVTGFDLNATWLYDVHFRSNSDGWAVGDRVDGTGVVYRTVNGGTSWDHPAIPQTTGLRSVFFGAGNHGWIGVADGSLLHTANGGASWNVVDTGFDDAILDLRFDADGTGFLCGANSLVAWSDDYGATWNRIAAGNFRNLDSTDTLPALGRFSDDALWITGTVNRNGVAHYLSFDGGLSWSAHATGADTGAFDYFDVYTGFGGRNGTIVVTRDGAAFETVGAVPAAGLGAIAGSAAASRRYGWVVGHGDRNATPYSGGSIAVTRDGGLSWQREQSNTIDFLNHVFFRDPQHGWAVGYRGTLLKYHTTGSWNAPAGTTIAGRVTDAATGDGAPSVTVVAESADFGPFSAVTNAHGLYAIADVPDDTYAVTATAAGFGRAAVNDVVVAGAPVTVDLDNGGGTAWLGDPPGVWSKPTDTAYTMTGTGADGDATLTYPIATRDLRFTVTAVKSAGDPDAPFGLIVDDGTGFNRIRFTIRVNGGFEIAETVSGVLTLLHGFDDAVPEGLLNTSFNAENTLAIEANSSGVAFLLNGTVVHHLDRPAPTTDDNGIRLYARDSAAAPGSPFDTVTFDAITVAPVADALELSAVADPLQAGAPFPLTVTLRDADSAILRSDSTTRVTLTIEPGTGTDGATLGGTTTATVVQGIATFTDLTIDRHGAAYRITAEAGPLLAAESNAFAVASRRGDFDGDGIADLADAMLGLQVLAGQTPPAIDLAGDVDGDGILTMVDVNWIINRLGEAPGDTGWVLATQETVGSGGGAVASSIVTVTVPPGALADDTTVAIYHGPAGSRPNSGIHVGRGMPFKVAFSASPQADISLRCLPDPEAQSADSADLRIAILYAARIPSRNRYRDSVAPLTTTVDPGDGALTATAPAGAWRTADDAASPGRADTPEFYELEAQVTETTGATLDTGGTFRIYYATDVDEQYAESVRTELVAAKAFLESRSYRFTNRTTWPVDVEVYDLDAYPDAGNGEETGGREEYRDGTAGIYRPGPTGINAGALLISTGLDAAALKVTCGHELFHMVHDLYTPPAIDRHKAGHDYFGWLEEATAIWLEGEILNDPGRVDPFFAANAGFVRMALQNPDREVGYGSSGFIRYLTDTLDTAVPLRIWEAVSAQTAAYNAARAIRDALATTHYPGTDLYTIWADFAAGYLLGTIHPPDWPVPASDRQWTITAATTSHIDTPSVSSLSAWSADIRLDPTEFHNGAVPEGYGLELQVYNKQTPPDPDHFRAQIHYRDGDSGAWTHAADLQWATPMLIQGWHETPERQFRLIVTYAAPGANQRFDGSLSLAVEAKLGAPELRYTHTSRFFFDLGLRTARTDGTTYVLDVSTLDRASDTVGTWSGNTFSAEWEYETTTPLLSSPLVYQGTFTATIDPEARTVSFFQYNEKTLLLDAEDRSTRRVNVLRVTGGGIPYSREILGGPAFDAHGNTVGGFLTTVSDRRNGIEKHSRIVSADAAFLSVLFFVPE